MVTLLNIGTDGAFFAAVGSAIAAIFSACVAWRMYKKEKEKEKFENDKDLFYAIVQIASLFNKLDVLYFDNAKTDESIEKLKKLDKRVLFDENNRAFYNPGHPYLFNFKFINLALSIATFKAMNATKNKYLIVDYSNVLLVLSCCQDILNDAYKLNGYGNSEIMKIVEEVIFGNKGQKSNKDNFVRSFNKRRNIALYIFNWFNSFFEQALNVTIKQELTSEQILDLEEKVAKIFLMEIMGGKLRLDKDEKINKEKYGYSNEVTIAQQMLEYYIAF